MGWVADIITPFLNLAKDVVPRLRHERRQKETLRKMLTDSRFTFRSTQRLMDSIGADRATTERLLLALGARRSETSDEWTFKPPPR